MHEFTPLPEPIEPVEPKAEWVRADEASGYDFPRPLVLVNGTFDVLHVGHLQIVNTAIRQAATVIVSIDSDEMVRRKKGPERPILTWVERAAQIAQLGVDFIHEALDDADFQQLVSAWKPDFRVRGADYIDQESRIAIPSVYVEHVSDISSSDIVQRILGRQALRIKGEVTVQ